MRFMMSLLRSRSGNNTISSLRNFVSFRSVPPCWRVGRFFIYSNIVCMAGKFPYQYRQPGFALLRLPRWEWHGYHSGRGDVRQLWPCGAGRSVRGRVQPHARDARKPAGRKPARLRRPWPSRPFYECFSQYRLALVYGAWGKNRFGHTQLWTDYSQMKKLLSGGDTRRFFMQSFFLHFVQKTVWISMKMSVFI